MAEVMIEAAAEIVVVAEQERPGHDDERRQCDRYKDGHSSLLS